MCVHELIEAQARSTPGSVALEFQTQRLTYAELDERGTRLANHLLRLGVQPESLVAVCLERSLDLVVVLLAVMKAGCAYVPLDPAFPLERLTYMLNDSAAALLVASHGRSRQFAGFPGTVLALEEAALAIAAESNFPRPISVSPEHLVYVIYTSGSTGQPKGVMIPHRAVVNLLQSMRKEPGLTAKDVVLAVTTFSFDMAVLELFLPLIVGARIVLGADRTVIDGERLGEELRSRQVTFLQSTPATWRMLLNSGWRGDKRLKALSGGEALPRDLAERLLERVGSLWNLYGPTETTVWSLLAQVHSEPGAVPIGTPIANTTVYVLDENGRPATVGVPGTLYIGGDGLAVGYKNRPELTAQKFIANPLPESKGERIYNTGDQASYRPDGRLQYLGRLDSQVKIRGYRIELEEIESVLRLHPAVQEAVVAARSNGDGEQRLVAYMVPNGRPEPSSEIRRHAANVLPAYMMPSAFLFIDAVPLTPNGKIDRKALPDPDAHSHRPLGRKTVWPRTPLEAALATIFQDLLAVSPISVTDNFFELGGYSLLAGRLVARIEKELGHSIPVAALFQAPTVQQLARKLQDRTYHEDRSPLVELRKGGNSSAEPLFCIHWLDATLVTFHKIASLLQEDRAVYGLQPGGTNGDSRPPQTIPEMAALYRREIRASFPNGPYYLAGSCLGGVVAFEIAQQLVAEGAQVDLLVLIDAFLPGRLEHLHERPKLIEHLDSYLGEFLLSPAAAARRWFRESAVRLLGRSHANHRLSFKSIGLQAEAGYRPQPYPGKLTLMICSDAPFRAYEDRRLAWGSVALGGFEVRVVPGDHSTMEKEPNIQVLGREFQRCFDRVRQESRGSECAVSNS